MTHRVSLNRRRGTHILFPIPSCHARALSCIPFQSTAADEGGGAGGQMPSWPPGGLGLLIIWIARSTCAGMAAATIHRRTSQRRGAAARTTWGKQLASSWRQEGHRPQAQKGVDRLIVAVVSPLSGMDCFLLWVGGASTAQRAVESNALQNHLLPARERAYQNLTTNTSMHDGTDRDLDPIRLDLAVLRWGTCRHGRCPGHPHPHLPRLGGDKERP